jgi:hypothetical protein
MASETGIINAALRKIGSSRITSRTDGSEAANALDDVFDDKRDEVLRGHTWNFAKARAQLAQVAGAPAFGFDHWYQLPADYLRVAAVYRDDKARSRIRFYRIEAGRLLCDDDDVYLLYVKRVTDPNAMMPDFREALAFRLASEVAVALTNSTSLAKEMGAEYQRRLAKAQSNDAQEDGEDEDQPTEWELSRQ